MPHSKNVKNTHTRIYFKYLGNLYKFLNFSTSKDNSFHFHLYEESGKMLKYYPLKKLPDGRLKIDMKNLKETEFIRNKFTFHPSGVLHSSDKDKNRFKDGLKGIAFNDISDSNLVLILAPKQVNALLKSEPPKKGHTLIIELIDQINPFTLNFEVFRKSKRNVLKQIPVDIINGPHTIEWPDLEFGLRFYIQSVGGNPLWPEVSMVLKRIVD